MREIVDVVQASFVEDEEWLVEKDGKTVPMLVRDSQFWDFVRNRTYLTHAKQKMLVEGNFDSKGRLIVWKVLWWN